MDVQEILDYLGYDEWSGDMDVLECPHGWTVEHDGGCPDGCVSPLRLLGLI